MRDEESEFENRFRMTPFFDVPKIEHRRFSAFQCNKKPVLTRFKVNGGRIEKTIDREDVLLRLVYQFQDLTFMEQSDINTNVNYAMKLGNVNPNIELVKTSDFLLYRAHRTKNGTLVMQNFRRYFNF